MGELLPREYKFCRCAFPVCRKQEEGLLLNACIRTVPANETIVTVGLCSCDALSDYLGRRKSHTQMIFQTAPFVT